MKNPNVCQLCETLFPDNTYLQNLDEDEEKRYCFNCVKFLSGEKNKEYYNLTEERINSKSESIFSFL